MMPWFVILVSSLMSSTNDSGIEYSSSRRRYIPLLLEGLRETLRSPQRYFSLDDYAILKVSIPISQSIIRNYRLPNLNGTAKLFGNTGLRYRHRHLAVSFLFVLAPAIKKAQEDTMTKKKIKGRQKTIIVALGALIFISLNFNLLQLALNIPKIAEANSASERLANYRELQSRQISSAKDNCEKIKADTENKWSDINQMRVVIQVMQGADDDDTLAREVIGRCYHPLFLISGVVFLDDDNIDDLVLKENTLFDIREDAFDQVKY